MGVEPFTSILANIGNDTSYGGTELANLAAVMEFLVHKLAAGETEDRESALVILPMQFFQPLILSVKLQW